MSCQRLLIVLTMLISLILTNGVGVRKADAGACKRIGRPNGCVTAADVKNNNLKAADLKDEAGADFADGEQTIVLTSTDTTVRSVTITAPRSGVVIVNASGFFAYGEIEGQALCAITTGTTTSTGDMFRAEGDADTNFIPFAATRGFTVERGSTTFNLVCKEVLGNVYLGNSSITAIYVPTRY